MRLGDARADGRTFVVTGATAGVGRAVATGLAAQGAQLVLLVRDEARGTSTLEEIARRTGNTRGELVLGDLSQLRSVVRAADDVSARFPALDGLLNLAGLLSFTNERTDEGLPTMLAVNHLAHFALTTRLLDRLRERPSARVVHVAGNPRFLRRPHIDLAAFESIDDFHGMGALTQTLFARVSFSFALARRLEGSGVTSNAFHPGHVGGSQLDRHAPGWARWFTQWFDTRGRDDCPIGVHLATSPDLERTNGAFFDDHGRAVPAIRERDDIEQGERLWALSERRIAAVLR